MYSKNSVCLFSNFINIIENDGCKKTRAHRVYFKVISEHDETSRRLCARRKIGEGKSTKGYDLWRASRRSGGDIHRMVLKKYKVILRSQVDEGENEQRCAINETRGTLRGAPSIFTSEHPKHRRNVEQNM